MSRARLSGLGESGVIETVKRLCRPAGRMVPVGIGDDAAVYSVPAGMQAAAAADMLVEGVHFDLSLAGFMDVGFKAVAANLSDIAAMGARPRYYLVSIAVRGETEARRLEEFYRGAESAAGEHGVRAIGGDTCSTAGPMVVNITMLGELPRGRCVRRGGARPGDDIYVTGALGGSAAGLAVLEAGGRFRPGSAEARLVSRHLRPAARVDAGLALAASGLVRSMTDISDGLSSDLAHILDESGAGAVVSGERLPLSEDAVRVFGREAAVGYAVSGGEDYELLFTARPRSRAGIDRLADRARARFTRIGSITGSGMGKAGSGGKNAAYMESGDGVRRRLAPSGYEHFR